MDYKALENRLVKFYCIFETTKEFNLNIQNKSSEDLPHMGLHFHLFISCPDNYSWFCFDALIYQILFELTSLPKKRCCISKYGYYKINDLDKRFSSYHTKQFKESPSFEMIMKQL